MGLLVKAAMDGGSGCALPKSTWFGGVEWGLNSSPCAACQAKCPSVCNASVSKRMPQPRGPREPGCCPHIQAQASPPPTPFWAPATPTSVPECLSPLPTQGLCTCYFLCPGCTPYPTTLPGQFLLHSDFKGIVTSSGKLSPANRQPRFRSLQSASNTPGAFLHHPHHGVSLCVCLPPTIGL